MQWADPAQGVPRAPHAGPHRRPEAGDLRVPRRRRGHLPGGRRARPTTTPRCAPTSAATSRLLDGAGDVFGGAALGDERIVVHPVAAAQAGRRLGRGTRRRPGAAAGRRPGRAADSAATRTSRSSARRASWSPRTWPPTWPRLLGSAATIDGDGRCDPATSRCSCAPTNKAPRCATALAAAGVPAVVTGTAQRVRHPGRGRLAHAAGGPRTAAPAGPAAGRGAHVLPRLHRRASCARRGPTHCSTSWAPPPRAGHACCTERGVAGPARGGHRRHRAARRGCSRARTASGASPTCGTSRRRCTRSPREASSGRRALVELAAARASARRPTTPATERSRRLEPDAAAVQIITIHRSKGLEFPVVYVPFGWDRECAGSGRAAAARRRRRCGCSTSAGKSGAGYASAARRIGPRRQARSCGCSTSRSPGHSARSSPGGRRRRNTATSPLHRLLFGAPHARAPSPRRATASRRRGGVGRRWRTSPRRCWRSSGSTTTSRRRRSGTPRRRRPRASWRWPRSTRSMDRLWRRTSYSALTAGAGHDTAGDERAPGVGSRALDASAERRRGSRSSTARRGVAAADSRAVMDRAPEMPTPAVAGASAPRWQACRAGTAFGTLVHAVLEAADLTAADLAAELTARCAEQLARPPLPGVGATPWPRHWLPVALTPLGPLAGGVRLADVAPATGSPSWTSSCRSAGGDHPTGATATLGESPRCCAPTCPPTTRSPATPTAWPPRCSRTSRCAAT